MDAVTTCLIVGAFVLGLLAIAMFVSVRRSSREQPTCLDGYGFAFSFLCGIASLVILGAALGRIGESWATVGVVAVNVFIQPICLFLFASGIHKSVMGLSGRIVYAWRVVPLEMIPADEYRVIRRMCVYQGIVLCLLGAGLGWFCVSRLW